MVNIEKRYCFWHLNSQAPQILKRIQADGGNVSIYPLENFYKLLERLGFDRNSSALWEVLKIAVTDDQSAIDTQVLFHVIAEAVAKVRDRNVSFWMTVITITGSSISWVDFRRKLSKWLSTNGMGIPQIKNVITFVQQNVDPQSSGLVKKESFLKFAEDLMGHDCLLSPESFLAVTLNATTPAVARAAPQQSFQQESLTRSPVIAPHAGDISSPADSSSGLNTIRLKLGVGSLQKLFASRQRIVFALFRISSINNSEQKTRNLRTPVESNQRKPGGSLALLLAVQLVILRRLHVSFFQIARSRSYWEDTKESGKQEAIEISDDEDESGPSWTVTIQAVAVANLFGILRTCLSRAVMPAYFSIKSGHCVDVYNPLRKVLWAQSNQGKKDSLTALGKQPRATLEPINENTSEMRNHNKHPGEAQLEFNLIL